MNVLGMGPMELLLILVLALIVFGPAKLPEVAGQIGKAIADFRRTTGELSEEFNRTIQAEIEEAKAVKADLDLTRAAVKSEIDQTKAAITGMPAPQLVSAPAAAASVDAPAAETDHSSLTSNGVADGDAQPAVAAPQQWSWETAPEPSPAADAAISAESTAATVEISVTDTDTDTQTIAPPAAAGEPIAAEPAPTDVDASAAEPAEPKRSDGKAARDELLPPY
jgi:sec-independent protein translocase protein TatB